MGKYWNLSEKTKKRMSIARRKRIKELGYMNSMESREKMRVKATGRKHTEETKEKLRKINMGKKLSKEHRKNIGLGQLGRIGPMKGKHHSEESKRRMREIFKGNKGKKNGAWKGGISIEPYTIDWTKTLKRSIRERDKYICQICGKEPAIIVHHIDYDKKNCNPKNLITLCRVCHTKTNFNRESWINYFNQKIK